MQPNGLADFKYVNKRNKDIFDQDRETSPIHPYTYERLNEEKQQQTN